ncbi:MAG: carboxypeptidase-like regulatory domain-containing protein [Gemmatimonadota bacterium]
MSPNNDVTVRTVIRAAIGSALAIVAMSEMSSAQATLRGRVVDSETGRSLGGARVNIRGIGAPLTTDSLGQFEVTLTSSADAQITIQRVGYAFAEFKVRVPASGAVEKVFSLDFTGQQLETIVVQARAEQLMPRYSDFEQRRSRGLGAFFRWDELNKGSFGSVGDALRTVRGVRIRCNQQTFECYAGMTRAPECPPTWFIDGQEVKSFHENTPIRDVYGIEVYRGPGEIPAEFGGSNAACGVIVMWTKSRPYRSTP